MISIKILGPGCSNCKKLESIAKQVVEQMAIKAEIIKITDYNEIMAYDILATPGLVINEKLVSYGRIPALTEVAEWLTDALEPK